MGAAELLQMEAHHNSELVGSIIKSTKRGADLTRRLLAFARKQPLKTARIDVVRLIQDVVPMLERLIGQDIRLELRDLQNIWAVETDPAPLEEALVNLTVNARDAISTAGVITVSCKNHPNIEVGGRRGDYVEIAINDSGVGMAPSVLAQARDPFFTTKPVGKGSGLGLAMIDGYVKQSGGGMQIRSAEGKGTRVSVMLPRAKQLPQRVVAKAIKADAGNTETVLIVEDNTDLAVLLKRQLSRLNYQATYATDRRSAFQLAAEAGGFDLVLSDVLLADGERGPSVVKDLLHQYPKMKSIFMTGFASEDEDFFKVDSKDHVVLRKPFKIGELANVIQAVLRQAG